eukprot:TRINITY_DN2542_c0_g2_i2.p3 TRINITY_DN2542_c0_g2~~TRINITY_DN2542_c0_g2_i2.p3  ORF type:complete len:111 (-),score=17.58 TRINITY_DN2542_c0_g2_i2:425-757(-)
MDTKRTYNFWQLYGWTTLLIISITNFIITPTGQCWNSEIPATLFSMLQTSQLVEIAFAFSEGKNIVFLILEIVPRILLLTIGLSFNTQAACSIYTLVVVVFWSLSEIIRM